MATLTLLDQSSSLAAPSNPKPRPKLTSAALAQLDHHNAGPDPWSAEAVNDTLARSRNFLSDEDQHSHRPFAERCRHILDFLEIVAEKRIPCDMQLYRHTQEMLRIHETRLSNEDRPMASHTDLNYVPALKTSLRPTNQLARDDLSWALRKEDRPPFTLYRHRDQTRFLAALKEPYDSLKPNRLRELERRAYEETLLDPSKIKDKKGGATFEDRAINRGRHRAALQIALRTLASNDEQRFGGSWWHRVVQLSLAVDPRPPEPIMALPLPENERPTCRDPFEYTKKYQQLQIEQKFLASRVADEQIATGRAEGTQPFLNLITSAKKPRMLTHHLYARAAAYYRLMKAVEERRRETPSQIRDPLVGALVEGWGPHLPRTQPDVVDGLEKPRVSQPQERRITSHEFADIERAVRELPIGTPLNEDVENMAIRVGEEILQSVNHWQESTYEQEVSKSLKNKLLAAMRAKRRVLADFAPFKMEGKYQTTVDLTKPLTTSAPLRSEEAAQLLHNEVISECSMAKASPGFELDRIWSFSSAIPSPQRKRTWFTPRKWELFNHYHASQPQEDDDADGPMNVDDDNGNESVKKPLLLDDALTQFHPPTITRIPYKHLAGGAEPSYRALPEEIGFEVAQEDSREHTPVPGQGMFMPSEIRAFDWERERPQLEGLSDPREEYGEGEPEEFARGLEGDVVDSIEAHRRLVVKVDAKEVESDESTSYGLPSPPLSVVESALQLDDIFRQRTPLPSPAPSSKGKRKWDEEDDGREGKRARVDGEIENDGEGSEEEGGFFYHLDRAANQFLTVEV
ncbi:MAG: hypothetical protein M1833_003821 [Piccolia ochrophora]|nr:MAG: hypothetical protein M1833_003821 [Piccolia ochrophora]